MIGTNSVTSHSTALHVLLGSQWEMAWGLNGGVQTVTPEVQSFLAVLSCKPSNKANAEGFAAAAAACSIQWSAAPTLVQGNAITAVGSPFGAISPPHFANSIVHGIISNCWSPESGSDVRTSPYLLMADMRCLPGMEGGAALDGQGKTVAMMMIPLFSRAFNAEVTFQAIKQAVLCTQDAAVACHMCETVCICCGRVSVVHRWRLSPAAALHNIIDGLYCDTITSIVVLTSRAICISFSCDVMTCMS